MKVFGTAISPRFTMFSETKAFDTDCVGKRKARKAHSYFKRLHVDQVLTYSPKDSDDLVVVK